MIIEMSKKEYDIMNDVIIQVSDGQNLVDLVKTTKALDVIKSEADERYGIKIDEKYVVGVYGEVAKWLPAIVQQTKSWISLIQMAAEAIVEKDRQYN